MSFDEYFKEVSEKASHLGYSYAQICIFHSDIYDCYLDGKSVEVCIDEVF